MKKKFIAFGIVAIVFASSALAYSLVPNQLERAEKNYKEDTESFDLSYQALGKASLRVTASEGMVKSAQENLKAAEEAYTHSLAINQKDLTKKTSSFCYLYVLKESLGEPVQEASTKLYNEVCKGDFMNEQ